MDIVIHKSLYIHPASMFMDRGIGRFVIRICNTLFCHPRKQAPTQPPLTQPRPSASVLSTHSSFFIHSSLHSQFSLPTALSTLSYFHPQLSPHTALSALSSLHPQLSRLSALSNYSSLYPQLFPPTALST